jgi:hypothetical protein
MPSEIEIKQDVVRQLLSTSKLNFENIKEITDCAEKLTDFITGKSQNQEPCDA